MAETKSKRIRSTYYTNVERGIFIDILQKYKYIVENVKTDGVILKQKENAWDKIVLEFNANSCVTKRTVKQLKSLYDNMKRKAKADRANERVEIFKTGGGSFTSRLDENTNKLLAIISEQVEPLSNCFDSDSQYLGENTQLSKENERNVILQSTENNQNNSNTEVILSGESIQNVANNYEFPTEVKSSHFSGKMEPVNVINIQNEKHISKIKKRPCNSIRKETEAVKARKRIAELSVERKLCCEEERKVLIQKENREKELHNLKKEILEIKKRAQLAKAEYYEAKLSELKKKNCTF